MSGDLDPVAADPMAIVAEWLPANDDVDRPQITLATVSTAGGPDARTVLMSEFDASGFYFHTDALSRKAAQIAAEPRVTIVVLWPNFTKQLVIQGVAEVAPPEEIAAAYAHRSLYLQQLAWQNTASFAQLTLDERVVAWQGFMARHVDGFPQPDTWVGYRVRPTRLTFWQSNPDTASRREEYTLDGGAWQLSYLPG